MRLISVLRGKGFTTALLDSFVFVQLREEVSLNAPPGLLRVAIQQGMVHRRINVR